MIAMILFRSLGQSKVKNSLKDLEEEDPQGNKRNIPHVVILTESAVFHEKWIYNLFLESNRSYKHLFTKFRLQQGFDK
jgi:hypothetical protein